MKIPLRQKITLITFGIFLSLVVLETGLRLGGYIFLSVQEYRNYLSFKKKGDYRILCLGESTTAGGYPRFLEEILNQEKIGIKFSVIDGGIPAVSTAYILSQLENNLNKYKPDMVITMIGINNENEVVSYGDIVASKIALFLRSFRTYKLARLLRLHLYAKLKEMDFGRTKAKEAVSPVLSSFEIKEYGAETNAVGLTKNPNEDIKMKAESRESHFRLAENYMFAGEYIQAEEEVKKAIEQDPQDYNAYLKLAHFYRMSSRMVLAEEMYKKIIELNPRDGQAYCELANLYRQQGQYAQAEDMYKKAIEKNPQNSKAYTELGQIFIFLRKYTQAEMALKKAIELNPADYLAYGSLMVMYKEKAKDGISRQDGGEKNKPIPAFRYRSDAQADYLKLKRILDSRKIKLVSMQYPMRSVQPLKDLLCQEDSIIFVDNEKIFKDAVAKYGYRAYFTDMFGGDFGHCTDKGNGLLAKNIAGVILKEVFKK
ncbi:MAG: tetratricopeptide repeat protein [Candidatus Omnitrophica bacterium]|nr:tetratricopeptide repeat protein [Candidatus Omnitrophota bacterium]